MKKAKLLLATLTMSVVLSMTALAGEWKHDSKGWWYRNDDGTYPTSSWVADGKDWYYVDAEGTMQTEDLVDGQITYHLMNLANAQILLVIQFIMPMVPSITLIGFRPHMVP